MIDEIFKKVKILNLSANQPYHRSLRLKDYDYSSTGAYFLTICTHNRLSLFGTIIGEEMILNENGKIVREDLLKTPEIRPAIYLDAYIIMPNHVHVIILIKQRSGDLPVARPNDSSVIPIATNKLKPGSIGAFVAGFKSNATVGINKARKTPGTRVWQTNYYEHVIRNEIDLNEIREYILNNPLKWALDRENPDCNQ